METSGPGVVYEKNLICRREISFYRRFGNFLFYIIQLFYILITIRNITLIINQLSNKGVWINFVESHFLCIYRGITLQLDLYILIRTRWIYRNPFRQNSCRLLCHSRGLFTSSATKTRSTLRLFSLPVFRAQKRNFYCESKLIRGIRRAVNNQAVRNPKVNILEELEK